MQWGFMWCCRNRFLCTMLGHGMGQQSFVDNVERVLLRQFLVVAQLSLLVISIVFNQHPDILRCDPAREGNVQLAV